MVSEDQRTMLLYSFFYKGTKKLTVSRSEKIKNEIQKKRHPVLKLGHNMCKCLFLTLPADIKTQYQLQQT